MDPSLTRILVRTLLPVGADVVSLVSAALRSRTQLAGDEYSQR
jgi:hypothetical protein